MTQYDPKLYPMPGSGRPLPGEPVYTETVIVRRESNTGWWIAGGLAMVIVIAVFWILASRATTPTDDTEARLAEAQAAQAVAQAFGSCDALVIGAPP